MAFPAAAPGDDTFVGLIMLEQPPDWWLPPGFTLSPNGATPLQATDPAGNACFVYAIPGYQPSQQQVDTVADVIERELGPVPREGLDPSVYRFVSADRDTPIGLINRAILYPIDQAALLLHLASYGIDATIVGSTELAARRGWMEETSAGRLRRDLGLLTIVLGAEAGRAPEVSSAALRTTASRAAVLSRASGGVLSPIVLRAERATGLPFGRMFRVVDLVEADPALPGSAMQGRTVQGWLSRIRAGQAFDRAQARQYQFNQVYIVKDSGRGYWILDSYGPSNPAFGAGPVSRKFTQLADIRIESAASMLQEAYRKYRPGQTFANVPWGPRDLLDATSQGQLWLEVPVQTKPIPGAVLATARQLSIKVRDVTGKVYQ